MKIFNIIQNELPENLLPPVDDMVVSICALTNLLPPLCATEWNFDILEDVFQVLHPKFVFDCVEFLCMF